MTLVAIPRQPAADPQLAAEVNRLARHYARAYGDTPQITAARRAALNAELAQYQNRPVEGAAA